MPFWRKTPRYVSEATTFINAFLRAHPEVAKKQVENRATWWDRKLDFEAIERERAEKLPERGYKYYDDPPPQPPGEAGDAGR